MLVRHLNAEMSQITFNQSNMSDKNDWLPANSWFDQKKHKSLGQYLTCYSNLNVRALRQHSDNSTL